ncbi:hypothetical protein FN846DRAFT_887001 [Sphaerosporella brunnea]|uniref:Altered inheritance of mitochondria protein 11 n=1 Tax=Sphaerosporella brunnea TaxID=1250544 RepID=A0A5J5F766_9PEZI|nr:hypothetical protein FN846DRAFT_887001 [Sphaerosporella brunnea]
MNSYLSSWLPWGSTPSPPPPPSPAFAPPPPPQPCPPKDAVPAVAEPRDETKRFLKQLALPVIGGAFLLLSMRLTRRSTVRRQLAMIPPYYHPNNQPPVNPPSGALDAVEALQLATLNVFSVAMLLVGGGAFALDVSNVEDLRERFRASDKGDEWEAQKRAAEEEFEEWLVTILARKELKDRVKSEVEKELEKNK